MANLPDDTNKNNFIKTIFYGDGRESPADNRNVVLTVTFQAAVNPPGGVWQDEAKGHKPGQAIYASNSSVLYLFLSFNTVALSAFILLIIRYTYGFSYYFEVFVATVCMAVTYGSASFAVTPHKAKFTWVLLLAIVPFAPSVGYPARSHLN